MHHLHDLTVRLTSCVGYNSFPFRNQYVVFFSLSNFSFFLSHTLGARLLGTGATDSATTALSSAHQEATLSDPGIYIPYLCLKPFFTLVQLVRLITEKLFLKLFRKNFTLHKTLAIRSYWYISW